MFKIAYCDAVNNSLYGSCAFYMNPKYTKYVKYKLCRNKVIEEMNKSTENAEKAFNENPNIFPLIEQRNQTEKMCVKATEWHIKNLEFISPQFLTNKKVVETAINTDCEAMYYIDASCLTESMLFKIIEKCGNKLIDFK